jgi:hypothetical protein
VTVAQDPECLRVVDHEQAAEPVDECAVRVERSGPARRAEAVDENDRTAAARGGRAQFGIERAGVVTAPTNGRASFTAMTYSLPLGGAPEGWSGQAARAGSG